MHDKQNPKSGADFTDLTVKLLDDTYELCEETYAATQELLPANEARNLIKRSEVHIAEYNALLEQYTGGRKDAIRQADPHIRRLIEFTDTLKNSTKKSS